MSKKLTVLEFAQQIDSTSDHIPVVIKEGPKTLTQAESLFWLTSHGAPGILESKIISIELCRQQITIRIRPKEYNFKP